MAERRRAERFGELLAYAVIGLLLLGFGAWQYAGNRAAAGVGNLTQQRYASLLPALREAQRRGEVARTGSVEAWVRHYYERRRHAQHWTDRDVEEDAARFAAWQRQQEHSSFGPSLWGLLLSALVASLVVKTLQSGALRLSV